MSDNIKLPPHSIPEVLTSARKYAEAYAREAVRLNAQADEKPMFWVRLCSDGCYEGPIHDSSIEDVRKQSGAWHPLYLAAPAAPQPAQQDAKPIYQYQLATGGWIDQTRDSYEYNKANGVKGLRIVYEAAPQPAQAEQADARDAARWRYIAWHIGVAWDEQGFTSLVRIVSDKHREMLGDMVDRMMSGDLPEAAPQPAQQPVLAEKDALLRQALDALEGFVCITNDSQGVAGYHLSGDTAEWDEFDEVDAASNTIEAIRNHLGVKND